MNTPSQAKSIKPKKLTAKQWEEIARQLANELLFALSNFKVQGMGMILNRETGDLKHWREHFADTLELVPGFKIDREAMYYMDMTKKERLAFRKVKELSK